MLVPSVIHAGEIIIVSDGSARRSRSDVCKVVGSGQAAVARMLGAADILPEGIRQPSKI